MDVFEPDSTSTAATDTTQTDTSFAVEIDKQAISKEIPAQEAVREVGVERAREVGAPLELEARTGGGDGGGPRRLLLIGLDGAAPELVLGAWHGGLRTLDLLAERGVTGRIRSSLPCASLPAWLCLLTGQDPGQLGIYGPRVRPNHSYTPPIAVDSRTTREPRLWDILGAAGKHVGIVGAPATTPAPRVSGHLISDNLHSERGPTIFPAALERHVTTWLEDVSPARAATPNNAMEQLIQDVYIRAEQRFMLARRLLARDSYDCFVVADDGIATLQRALWDSLDTAHPGYAEDHPFAGAIGSFYRFVDDQISELLEFVDDNTIIAVVSAGGAQALHGELALNEWLLATGELVLKSPPSGPTTLERCDVDWEHTRAWAGEVGAIYLNVAGREPHGVIPADEVEQASARIAERLCSLAGPDRAPGAVEVYHTGALYAITHGVAPDLLAVCTHPGWRTTAALDQGQVWNDTRNRRGDTAFESPSGLVILYDPRNLGGGMIGEATIYDIVPTLLALLEQPIPARLRGKVLRAN